MTENPYTNGKIYEIVCNMTGKRYIGSTILTLNRRLTGHKSGYKRYKNGNGLYMTSFNILEAGNYDIKLLENVCCKTKEELLIRERFHIENIECVNKIIPSRTEKEYLQTNKARRYEQYKQWKEANKEYRLQYMRELYARKKQDKLNSQ